MARMMCGGDVLSGVALKVRTRTVRWPDKRVGLSHSRSNLEVKDPRLVDMSACPSERTLIHLVVRGHTTATSPSQVESGGGGVLVPNTRRFIEKPHS